MRKFVSGALAAILSVSFIGAEMLPASASPLPVPQGLNSTSDVQAVDWRRGDRRYYKRRAYQRRGDGYYWRGHRGYDHYRRGYRRHGDLWFPLAAFATGAIISGAIANDRPPAYRGNAHIQYCYNRYKSYRASDNTFQPYNGPRQQCR